MSRHLIINIAKSLEAVNDHFNTVNNHDGVVPQIEVDILKEHVRAMYEHIITFQKQNEQSAMIHSRKREFINEPATPKVIPVQEMVGAQVAAPAPVPARPEIQKPEVILPHKPEPVIVQEKVEVATPEKIVEAPIIEKAMPAISTAPVQEHVVSKPNKTKQVASLFDNAGVLAHQFDEQKSVADKIASDPQSSRVADAMHQSKIVDLKKAIGINEKFLFINELFEGSMQAYTETIEKLNNSSDITQAKQLLEPLHMKYNWNTSIVAYQKLMDLVERKVS